MNKFELKGKIIDAIDQLDRIGGLIMQDGCADEETGKLRSRTITELRKAKDGLVSIMQEIY